MALNIVGSSDGRRLRSERSQTAIIEAALTLMEEGTLVPTAQQIADRAGVGIRSFFRHFADMDSLFLAADEMLLDVAAEIEHLLQKPWEIRHDT